MDLNAISKLYNKDLYYGNIVDSFTINDQLDIWSWVLNQRVDVQQYITSPFRPDLNPNCKLREYKTVVLFTDFAFPQYNKYTCIHGVQRILAQKGLRISLNDTALFVYINFAQHVIPNLSTVSVVKGLRVRNNNSKSTNIHFNSFTNSDGESCFIDDDKQYWENTGVSIQDLKDLFTFSCKEVYVNSRKIYLTWPTYAYWFPESNHIKIYQPNAKYRKDKWLGTASKNDVWKANGGKTKLIINKSAKDLLILKNLLPDYTHYGFQNEGVIPDNVNYSKFDKIFILFDNDAGGINGSNRLRTHIMKYNLNVNSIYFNKEDAKDAYEIIKKYGQSELMNELVRLNLIPAK